MRFSGLPLKIVATVAGAVAASALIYTQLENRSSRTSVFPAKRTYESTIGNLTLRTDTEWSGEGFKAQFTLTERKDNLQNHCELATSKIRTFIEEAEETVGEIEFTFKNMASYAPKQGDTVFLSNYTPWSYDGASERRRAEGIQQDLQSLLTGIESWSREQKEGRAEGEDVDWICFVNHAYAMRLVANAKMHQAKVHAAENVIRQWYKYKAPLIEEYSAAVESLKSKYVSGEMPAGEYGKALCDLRSRYVPQEKIIDELVLQRYADLMETLAQDLWAIVDDLRHLVAHVDATKGPGWSSGRSPVDRIVYDEIGSLGSDVRLTMTDYQFFLRLIFYDCEREGVGRWYRDDSFITADKWLNPLASLTANISRTIAATEARLIQAALIIVARSLARQPLEGLTDSAKFPVSFCMFRGGDLRVTARNSRGRQVVFPIALPREDDCIVDLDIDSDNNNGGAVPDRSEAEDKIEDDPGAPGKFLHTNVEDLDRDGIPGLADGFDLLAKDPKDDQDSGGYSFTPLVLELPNQIDAERARIRFTYNASDPRETRVQTIGKPPYERFIAAGGQLRIWTKRGNVARNKAPADAGGDYVAVDRIYTMAQLGGNGFTSTLFLEAIAPDAVRGDQLISVEVDPDGNGPAGFELKDKVRVTVLGCPTPSIATRAGDGLGGHGWTLDYEVTADDGLEVQNVRLGGRYMAARLNVPYFKLKMNGESATGELKPGGYDSATGLRSRLVGFYADKDLPDRIVIEAKYQVDKTAEKVTERFPNCMTVIQRYEFREEVVGDACEASGKARCARFFPFVSYSFKGETQFEKVQFPQRLHFMVNQKEVNAASIMEDSEGKVRTISVPAGPFPLPPVKSPPIPIPSVIIREYNPIDTEHIHHVIMGGRRAPEPFLVGPNFGLEIARWDNYHQTDQSQVSRPTVGLPEEHSPIPAVEAEPGCPECVHIHWRWPLLAKKLFPRFQDHNEGRVRIPKGSTQSVTVGIVAYNTQEGDPVSSGASDWRDLVNGEALGATRGIVFWYEGSSISRADDFFTHGGFFVPKGTPR